MRGEIDDFRSVRTPMYVIYESLLRRNLGLITRVASSAGVEVILALKAYALWRTFPVFREYIKGVTASSLYEARLGWEGFGRGCHVYSPAYREDEFDELLGYASHISFNSLAQYERFRGRMRAGVSAGLRVNPEYSEVGTALYNPCGVGSRFGVLAQDLPECLPEGIEGFHCHCLCESGADVFERTLVHIEERFGRWLGSLKWMNFGGGHLITREGYDTERLVRVLRGFKEHYPNLQVILEPGSAFAWQTGVLVAEVLDVVVNGGIRTAILDVSFTCHMPDCLEMPYQPQVRGARIVAEEETPAGWRYRLGGNSCLSGDVIGYWEFDHELRVGERIVFEDMMHYTTVKTTMFNGVGHPAIGIRRKNGEVEVLRQYGYEDYRDRMD